MESLNSQLSEWQKGEVGTFIGLSSNPSKSDTFRVRLQNRKGFNVQYLQQDFEHFIISELAAETSFTGITEVNTTAEATIPFFDICRKYDSSSRLAQSYPLGTPTLQGSKYHKGGQLCFLPSFTAKAYGHLEEATTLLLKEMKCRTTEDGTPVVMEWKFGREEFRAAFSKARNNTAPGFSGLPMTYWKAICEDDHLCDIYAAFLKTAFKQGFMYDRWLKSIQAMLQKKDLPYYMKLRIIELFELDYNAVLKYLFGKVFARYKQAAGFQNSESYGAVQGRSAHQALNSALIVYEHSRVTASPMAASPQDATGCFDLIHPEQTGIIQQAKGLNKEATKCNMEVLQKMERHIRTAKGVSERSLRFDKTSRNY